MAIISKVGRKSPRVRLLLAVIYLVLAAGGLSMVIPFLLMVATSLTGETDFKDYRIIPRYFHDRDARFGKFLHEKYQVVGDYTAIHASEYRTFADAALPVAASGQAPAPEQAERLDPATGRKLPPRVVFNADEAHLRTRVALWQEFKETLEPLEYGLWHVGRRALPGETELRWRAFLAGRYASAEPMSRDFGRQIAAFSEAFAPFERPESRLWPGSSGREGALWAEFKEGLEPRYRRPVDGTMLWQRHLRFRYERIEDANGALGTQYASFGEIPLPATRPANPPAAREWDRFVRGGVPFRFVEIGGDDGPGYAQFLIATFGSLDEANRQLGTTYAWPDAVRWPPANPGPAELDAISTFLRQQPAGAALSLDTPDLRFVEFLRGRFDGDPSRLQHAWGSATAAFDAIRPPYEEEDYVSFVDAEGHWMGWFLTRNYGEVVDYIAVRGRSLWNTLFLVVALIACSLTVNPLAAYALSRFRLSFANQVLIFLLATMAFPGEVTMIPNFLLMRSFPAWSWLVALAAGGVAAALVLGRTRGPARWLALPVGLGMAAVGAYYLTPLLGRAMGIPVAPVSLLNTFWALILPRMASGYGIFLLKGFFDSLPEEIFEAGRIDGASEMRMLWQIAFPLSRPILAVMMLQTFTAVYGSYLWALVVCQDESMWTLMVHIFQLQQWAPVYITMAATVLASIPTLLVFALAQNAIMRGIVIPAYK